MGAEEYKKKWIECKKLQKKIEKIKKDNCKGYTEFLSLNFLKTPPHCPFICPMGFPFFSLYQVFPKVTWKCLSCQFLTHLKKMNYWRI